jgi:large subunit ribosomal protein L6
MRPSSLLLSHIGSLPVVIPSSVKLIPTIQSNQTNLSITGPLGTQHLSIPDYVKLDHSRPDQVSLSVLDRGVVHQRARWGLSRTLIANAVKGVSNGYTKELNLVGVGYRASMASPTQLHLKLGFAHPVLIDLPSDVTATTPSSTSIVLSGIDLQRVGEVAARIRSWRVPEPYNVSLSLVWSSGGGCLAMAEWRLVVSLAGEGNLRRQRTS